jgi:hypothetical protein
MVTFKSAILGTVIFLNLVVLVFIWERQTIVIQKDIPSVANVQPMATRSEFLSKRVGVSRHGDYVVEDYREVQVWYNEKNHVVKRTPTGVHTYLRFWVSKRGKVIVDTD